MNDHEAARHALGSYVLGALDPADRSRVDAHLTLCAACRDELASYAALPGLMSRLTLEEVQAGPSALPPSLLPGALAAGAAARAAGGERVRRWRRAALGASSLAAAAGLAAVLLLAGRAPVATVAPDAAGTQRPLVATAGASGAGVASLRAKAWGTQVQLALHDLPREGTFTVYALDASGARTPAATWRATADGRAEVTGASALDPAGVAALQVVAGDGTMLLRSA